ncbi:MAG: TerB N-terminal domain-containing protein, partial [Thermoplasmata archaeon]|nr:TerB N-terminal domain-containing protein [Thermoplasmata archaeon]
SILIAFEHPPVLQSSFYIPSADILVSDTMGIEPGSGIESEWRRGGELVSDHRGEAMIYVFGEYEAPWRFDIAFMGTDRSHSEPYPRLLKSRGPSPDPFFHSPDEFLKYLRDPSSCPEADEEGVTLPDPDPSVIDAFLSDITAGSQGRMYSLLGDAIGGRVWADGPAVMPGDGFFDDMDRYAHADPGDAPYAPCDLEWPTYSDLTEGQLAWFLRWRGECRNGRYSVTDLGYVWLLLAELGDSDDTFTAEMIRLGLAKAYDEQEGDFAVSEFLVYNCCAVPLSRGEYPFRMPYQKVARIPSAGEAFYSTGSGPRFRREDAEYLHGESFSGYDVGISPDDFLEMTNYVLDGVHRYCLERHGVALPRYMLPKAPCNVYEARIGIPFRTPRRVTAMDMGSIHDLNTGFICAVPFTMAKTIMREDFGEALLDGDVYDETIRLMNGWLDDHPDIRDGMHRPRWEHPFEPPTYNWADGDDDPLCVEVELDGCVPRCTRTLTVPGFYTFGDLAHAINIAMDWWEGHKWVFQIDNELLIGSEEDEIYLDGFEIPVTDYADSEVLYVYDMGDGWEHTIRFVDPPEDAERAFPKVISFEGRSPPEDCGGVQGYAELLRILADPDDPEHREMSDWAEDMGFGDFDMEAANAKLAREGLPEFDDTENDEWMEGPEALPGAEFFEDMDRYAGRDPGDVPRVGCDMLWPSYSDLTEGQLAWYLHWRSMCDNGDYATEDPGYMWLYLSELLDRGDTDGIEEAASAFGSEDPGLDVPCQEVLMCHDLIGGRPSHIPVFLLIGMSPPACALFFEPPTGRFDALTAGTVSGCLPEELGDLGPAVFADVCTRCLRELDEKLRRETGEGYLRRLFPDLEFEDRPVYGWIPDRNGRTVPVPSGDGWIADAFFAVPAAVAEALRARDLIGGPAVKNHILCGEDLATVAESVDAWISETGLIR